MTKQGKHIAHLFTHVENHLRQETIYRILYTIALEQGLRPELNEVTWHKQKKF